MRSPVFFVAAPIDGTHKNHALTGFSARGDKSPELARVVGDQEGSRFPPEVKRPSTPYPPQRNENLTFNEFLRGFHRSVAFLVPTGARRFSPLMISALSRARSPPFPSSQTLKNSERDTNTDFSPSNWIADIFPHRTPAVRSFLPSAL